MTEASGFVTIVCGTVLLHVTKDIDLPLAAFASVVLTGKAGAAAALGGGTAAAAAEEQQAMLNGVELALGQADSSTLRSKSSFIAQRGSGLPP